MPDIVPIFFKVAIPLFLVLLLVWALIVWIKKRREDRIPIEVYQKLLSGLFNEDFGTGAGLNKSNLNEGVDTLESSNIEGEKGSRSTLNMNEILYEIRDSKNKRKESELKRIFGKVPSSTRDREIADLKRVVDNLVKEDKLNTTQAIRLYEHIDNSKNNKGFYEETGHLLWSIGRRRKSL